MLDTVASYSIHASLCVPDDAGAHQLLLTVPGCVMLNESKLCQTLLTPIWNMPAYACHMMPVSISCCCLVHVGCVVHHESKLCWTLLPAIRYMPAYLCHMMPDTLDAYLKHAGVCVPHDAGVHQLLLPCAFGLCSS